MSVVHMFEERRGAGQRPAVSPSVRTADADARLDAVALADDAVPVPEPLAGLLPGGLRRGEATALATRHSAQHPDYLALALLAGALNAGLWCAAVGVPDLGLAALAGMLGPARPAEPESELELEPSFAASHTAARQAALDRLLLVPDPGERWAESLAALADGVDLILVRPLTPASTETAHRVDTQLQPSRSPTLARPTDSTGPTNATRAASHGAALLVLGGWPTARLSLHIARADWTGLDGIGPTAGTGQLTGCRATVVAQGWATAGRPRAARLWLPDANGSVRALSDDPRTAAPDRSPSNAA